MNPVLKFELSVPITIFQEDDGFVSHCPVLDLSSQGTSTEEARENLIEAITGFVITCYEMGTLSKIFKECGFIPVSRNEIDSMETDGDFINIPLPFMLPGGMEDASYGPDSVEKA